MSADNMEVKSAGKPLTELLMIAGLCKSNNEGRKAIKNGGVKLADHKVTDPLARVGLVKVEDKEVITLVEEVDNKIVLTLLQNLNVNLS